MTNGQSSKSYGSLIISALLSILLTVVALSFNDMKGDINKLDERKANKDVVEVQLENISRELETIKNLIKGHG